MQTHVDKSALGLDFAAHVKQMFLSDLYIWLGSVQMHWVWNALGSVPVGHCTHFPYLAYPSGQLQAVPL